MRVQGRSAMFVNMGGEMRFPGCVLIVKKDTINTNLRTKRGCDMNLRCIRTVTIFALILAIVPCSLAVAQDLQEGKIYVGVAQNYGSWENPLHSEFIINGETVNVFSSNTYESIENYLKPGWNDITIKTTPQQPANKENHLTFQIGPMHRDPKNPDRFVMSPVLWKFQNGTDWKLKDGKYSHPLGPDVKEVTLNYHVYWAGLGLEGIGFKEGDYILQVEPRHGSWNSPVIATVSVNGTPLNSFSLSERQIIITSLLKPGKNEIKLVSHRVKNSFENNDIECTIAGPSEWSAAKNQYMLKPITSFKAMQGWAKNSKSGQLNNPSAPNADFIERTIMFMVKKGPKAAAIHPPVLKKTGT